MTVVDGEGDFVVDLAYHRPFNECNSSARLTDANIRQDMSGMFGEDEQFKPFGMLLLHLLSSIFLNNPLVFPI